MATITPFQPEHSNVAIVLMIGNRYFAHRKNKKIVTAWHLAGSTLFHREDLIVDAEIMLKAAGYKPVRKEVIASL